MDRLSMTTCVMIVLRSCAYPVTLKYIVNRIQQMGIYVFKPAKSSPERRVYACIKEEVRRLGNRSRFKATRDGKWVLRRTAEQEEW